MGIPTIMRVMCLLKENKVVISEIRALYNDENDLLRTVTKRIYEQWEAELEQWHLKKVEYIFSEPEFPVPSDNIEVAVETRHGWLIPSEWEFITEEWVCTRQAVDSERHGHTYYDHDSEVGVIREE